MIRACKPSLAYLQGGIELRAGLYSIFLRDWFRVYPRHHFFIVRAEDYYADELSYIDRLYRFAGVSGLDGNDAVREIIEATEVVNKNTRRTEPMLNETRMLLDEFYRPFNVDLSKLLRNDGFLWPRMKE